MVHRSLTVATAALAALLWHGHAAAQLQFPVNLPNNDFRLTWGNAADAIEQRARTLRNFSTTGSEAGFNCELTGEIRLGSRIESRDVRRLESELGISLYFIQAATQVMNDLDYQRELAWAVLDCKRPEERERSAEEQQERLDELRERALRRQAERRERRARQEED